MPNLFWLSILLCFVVGAAIDTSNVCLVRASRHLGENRPGMAVGIMVKTAAAAIVFYLETAFALHHRLPVWSYPSWITVAGAVLFAFGSVLNNACAVGTVGRIARGDFGHLATFAGALAVGLLLPRGAGMPPAPDWPPGSGLAWLLVVLAATAAVLIVARRRLQAERLLPYVLLGVLAAVITDWEGNWTWLDVAQHLQAGLHVGTAAVVLIGAVIVGATLAALARGHFHLKRPDPQVMLREFIGGGFMAAGTILIPSANDALAIYGVPSGSPNAVTGYLVMFAAMMLMVRLKRAWWRQNTPALGLPPG